MSNVRLSVWRESVWPPASYETKETKESILKRRKRKKETVSVCCLLGYRERESRRKTERRATGQQSLTRERVREKKQRKRFFVGGTT